MSKYIANSTQVPNAVFDELLPTLSNAALRCYLVITRQTTGWQKHEDYIAISQFEKRGGISKATAVKGCQELEDLGLIIKTEAKNRTSKYSLNLFNNHTCLETKHVQKLNNSCLETKQEVVQKLNTHKPNKPTNKKPNIKNKQKNETSSKFQPVKPDEVSQQVWNDLLDHRKSKRTSETATAWKTITNQLRKAQQATGDGLDTIISHWLANDWKGFNSSWYINSQPKQNSGNQNANNQSANSQLSEADQYEQDMLRQLAEERNGQQQTVRTVHQ